MQTLFDQYKESNVQLGVSDLYEIRTLRSGQDLATMFYSAQIGLKDKFDWKKFRNAVEAELKKNFGEAARVVTHFAISSNSHDVYFYFQLPLSPTTNTVFASLKDRLLHFFTKAKNEEILELGVGLLNIGVDTTRGTLICPDGVAELLSPIFEQKVSDDHHPVYLLALGKDGAVVETRRSIRKSAEQFGLTEFYPWLKKRGMSLEEYIDAFYNSNSGMLLLIGDPGTGKSTFTRTAIRQTGLPGYLVYDPDSIQSTSILDHFYGSQGGILGIEDADNFLKRREEGNTKLSSYLNYTDGVIKDPTKKLILSTNLSSLSKVDTALTRPGRCFDVVQFEPLTLDEAYVARDAAKLPYMQFDEVKYKDGIVLADALVEMKFDELSNRGFKTGFTQ